MKELVLLTQLDLSTLSRLKLAYDTTRRQVDADLVKGWTRYGGVKYERVGEQLVEVWALLEAGVAEWVNMFIAGDSHESSDEKDYHGENYYDHYYGEGGYDEDDYGGGDNNSINHQQIELEVVIGAGADGGRLRRRT